MQVLLTCIIVRVYLGRQLGCVAVLFSLGHLGHVWVGIRLQGEFHHYVTLFGCGVCMVT